MHTLSHRYKYFTPESRPQDENMDGSTLTFETLEHGGDLPDLMPGCIRVTDEQGNWCIYVPITVGGRPVQSHGYDLKDETP